MLTRLVCSPFQIGIYVVMFLEILQTLIKVLLVFSILIIAFGMAFYIVLSNSVNMNVSKRILCSFLVVLVDF